jgi:hypothetical protein
MLPPASQAASASDGQTFLRAISHLSDNECMKFASAFQQRQKTGFGTPSSKKFWRKKVKAYLTSFLAGEKVPSRAESMRLRKECTPELLRKVGVLSFVERGCAGVNSASAGAYPLLLPNHYSAAHHHLQSSHVDMSVPSSSSLSAAGSSWIPSSTTSNTIPVGTSQQVPAPIRTSSAVEGARAEYNERQLVADWVCCHGVTKVAVDDLLARLNKFTPSSTMSLPKRYDTLMKVCIVCYPPIYLYA